MSDIAITQDEVPVIIFKDGRYYSVRGTTKILGISRQRVHALIESGKLTSKVVDNGHYIPVDQVTERWHAKFGSTSGNEDL